MEAAVRVVRKGDRKNLLLMRRDPATGKRLWRSAGTSDTAEAEIAARRWEAETLRPTKAGEPRLSLTLFERRVIEEFLPTRSPNTQSGYRVAIRQLRKCVGEVKDLRLARGELFSRFAACLRRRKLAEETIANRLRHWQALLRWARQMGLVKRRVKIEMNTARRVRSRRGRCLTDEEFGRMLDQVAAVVGAEHAEPWRGLMQAMWHAGLRLEEARRLSWEPGAAIQADLDGGKYPRLVFRAEGQKSRKDETLPMTPELAELLRSWPTRDAGGPVFRLTHPTRKLSRTVATKTISAAGELAGITVNERGKPASAHDLRRSFGTRMAQRVKPLTLQKLMRHSSLNVTLRFYVDLECEDLGAELWGRGGA